MITKTRTFAAAFLLAAFGTFAGAQTFPSKPMRIIAPFPPGGGGDLMGRIIADGLAKRVGQPVVVENRPGGDTVVGVQAAAQASPDGHTLLITGDNIAIHEAYEKKLPYNSFRDIVPVTRVARVPILLVASNGSGFKSMQEVIAAARAKPGEVRFGHIGAGSHHFFSFKLIEQATGVRMLDVTYKGTGPATTALLANEVDLAFMGVGAGVQLGASGKGAVIGVSGGRREAFAPQVPTIAEGGVAGFDLSAIFYLFAPGQTAAALVTQLNRETVAVIQDKPTADRINGAGFVVSTSSSAEAVAEIRATYEKMRQVIRANNLKLED